MTKRLTYARVETQIMARWYADGAEGSLRRIIDQTVELVDVCEALGAFIRDVLPLLTAEQIRDAGLERRMVTLSDRAYNAVAKARGE